LSEKGIKAQIHRRVRETIHQPALGKNLHPRTDTRSAGPQPHQPEIRIRKGFERSLQQRMLVGGMRRLLRKRLMPFDQVQKISIGILEEHQPVALILKRLTCEFDTFRSQFVVRGIEMVY